MVLINEAVKQGHEVTMERIVSIFKPLIRLRLITKVECEGVAVISDAVTLETINLLLVGNSELVGMMSLEPHFLLVCR